MLIESELIQLTEKLYEHQRKCFKLDAALAHAQSNIEENKDAIEDSKTQLADHVLQLAGPEIVRLKNGMAAFIKPLKSHKDLKMEIMLCDCVEVTFAEIKGPFFDKDQGEPGFDKDEQKKE